MGGNDSNLEAGFSIQYLKEIHLFGQTVYITTTHISLLIVSIALIILAVVVNRKVKKAKPEDTPGTLQNIFELAVEAIDNMVHGIMGDNDKRFRNYIATVMLFVGIANISGLFGLRPPTADYGVTLPLGLITFAMIHYCGLKKNKMQHLTALFKPTPILFPINLIGEIAVPLSLSLRLFGNVLSGTVMMGLIYGLLSPPITTGIPAILHVYFDIFSGLIQTYVFCMLTMVYINDKISD
ncbi:MAG: F0F1 ATP synthase subunit A [Lachnospiraceae bacterium]|nr:F0F1 ATP synthase subunit A [Lachnospiraceae bacterium]